MFLRQDKNEYGTPVTWFQCNACGNEYSVCPDVKPDAYHRWDNCLADECPSYDPHRDADVLFMSGEELAAKKSASISMLRQRREKNVQRDNE